ncbi:Uncharacterised protein [Alcaligenes faecalis subsp. faecalis]|nr:Uncharacterised protein [Alcaligenes faecalis subsp. faecalis]
MVIASHVLHYVSKLLICDTQVTNAGGPLSMPFSQLETTHWQAALDQNFLAAVELIWNYRLPCVWL